MKKTIVEIIEELKIADEKQAKRLVKMLDKREKKELEEIEKEKAQKEVEKMIITIEWKKSSMWGLNPKANAKVWFEDGTYTNVDYTSISGCGYDKLSTAIAKVFNDFLKGQAYKIIDEMLEGKKEVKFIPYGLNHFETYYFNNDKRYFEGGVGISCYYNIAEFLGYNFNCVASGKLFEVYELIIK